MGFTFLLALGQMTTKGSIKNTKLPPGPVDSCPADNTTMISSMLYNSTMSAFGGFGSNMSASEIAMNVTFAVSGMVKSTEASFIDKAIPEP